MVTVIIPTYKRASFIDRAIQSVLNQTYKDIEIIVVDDNDSSSMDRKIMEMKMEKYKDNKRVIYKKHDVNKNGASARNTGISCANGEYVTFLDDDDFFLKDRIGNLVETLEKNKKFHCAYTNVVKINNGKIRNIVYANKSGNYQYDMLMQNSFLGTGSNIFFRRSVIDDLKKFDEDFSRYQDLEFMVRFFRKYQIIAVNECTVVKDDESRLNGANGEKLFNMLNLFLNKFEEDIKKYDNPQKIYYTDYNRLYNVVTDKRVKEKIKRKMALLGLHPKTDFKRLFLNKFVHVRKILSVMRGKIISRRLSDSYVSEIYNIVKEGNNYEVDERII